MHFHFILLKFNHCCCSINNANTQSNTNTSTRVPDTNHTHPTHTHTQTDESWHSFRCLVFCCAASIVGSHVCQPFSQRSICSNRIHTLWPRLTFVVSHVRNDFVSVWPSHTASLPAENTISAVFCSVWFCLVLFLCCSFSFQLKNVAYFLVYTKNTQSNCVQTC